jgi:biotin transporter BioY
MKVKLKHRFKREFRRQLRMAIAAAAGFIIAFSWKETIMKLIENQVQYFTTMTSVLNVSFVSSIVISILGVLVIIISTQLLKEK